MEYGGTDVTGIPEPIRPALAGEPGLTWGSRIWYNRAWMASGDSPGMKTASGVSPEAGQSAEEWTHRRKEITIGEDGIRGRKRKDRL